MGYDIHMHIEVKLNGCWHYYGESTIKRKDDLFSRLAGVRQSGNTYPPIVPPRGIPDDASAVTKLHVESLGSDGHTHSWLTYDEMMQVHNEFPKDVWTNYTSLVPFTVYLLGNCVTDYKDEDYAEYYAGIEDIRFIFWFARWTTPDHKNDRASGKGKWLMRAITKG